MRKGDEYGFLSLVVKSKNREKMSKLKYFPQQEEKWCFSLLYNSGFRNPFLKFRSVFKQQILFPNKKSKYFVLMMLKQNVSISPNHFFLTCQNETFVHFLIFFTNTVGSCIFQ